MTLAARLRRVYWRRIRRYRYETCGRPNHPYRAIQRGCGRPVESVWRASSGVWNYVVVGQEQTAYTIRPGVAGGSMAERAEGVGGVLCARCFDRLARERGLHLEWKGELVA